MCHNTNTNFKRLYKAWNSTEKLKDWYLQMSFSGAKLKNVNDKSISKLFLSCMFSELVDWMTLAGLRPYNISGQVPTQHGQGFSETFILFDFLKHCLSETKVISVHECDFKRWFLLIYSLLFLLSLSTNHKAWSCRLVATLIGQQTEHNWTSRIDFLSTWL